VLNLKKDVLEYSLHIKECLSLPLINLIDRVLYTDRSTWNDGKIATGVDVSVRSVETFGFDEEKIGNSVSKRIIYNDLMKFTSYIENIYREKVSEFYFSTTSNFEFLFYEKNKGGHYNYHTDYYNEAPRNLTILCGLNSKKEYEGGELLVQNQEEGIRLDKGDVICFPSNFMFPHKVSKVTSGQRKVLVIWTQ
tara:strand:+ start:2637 stop:3215 length:579 start_codon:yes stop_codon:yes gene_type:complete